MNASTRQEEEFLEGRFESVYGARRYKLFVPSTAAPAEGRPLLVMLHGCTQDADDIARGTRLNERAGARGWLVLYPEQPASANAQKCWNWYDESHQAREAGEPALLAALVADVARRYRADPRRVFVAGISAGGAMAVNLAVAYPERFAAAAAHSAVPYRATTGVMGALATMGEGSSSVPTLPPLRIPLFVVHGDRDAVVNARNGAQLVAQWRAALELAQGAALVSREEDGRSPDRREFHRVVYETPSGQRLLEWWAVRDLGHAWSGGSAAGTFTDERGPDATAAMVEFFARHEGHQASRPP